MPTNLFLHQRELRTAEGREIVGPNTDTLYSTLFIDLSIVDLEITLPGILLYQDLKIISMFGLFMTCKHRFNLKSETTYS